jgi:transcriptional regulator with XRE-family HTH domain
MFAHTQMGMSALFTKARAALIAWLDSDEEGRSQAALAKDLRINQSSVSLWVAGRSRPEQPMRVALFFLTGIAADAWLTDEERAFVERVRAVVAARTRKRTGVRRAARSTLEVQASDAPTEAAS